MRTRVGAHHEALAGSLAGLPIITSLWAQNVTLLVNQDFGNTELGWGKWPDKLGSRLELDPTVAQHGQQSLRITTLDAGLWQANGLTLRSVPARRGTGSGTLTTIWQRRPRRGWRCPTPSW